MSVLSNVVSVLCGSVSSSESGSWSESGSVSEQSLAEKSVTTSAGPSADSITFGFSISLRSFGMNFLNGLLPMA